MVWCYLFTNQIQISQRKRGERYLEIVEEEKKKKKKKKKQDIGDTVGCIVMEVCSLSYPLTQRMAMSSLLRAVEETG